MTRQQPAKQGAPPRPNQLNDLEGCHCEKLLQAIRPPKQGGFFMSANQLEHTRVPSFGSVTELQLALGEKDRFEPVDLYPRDGTCELAEVETTIAELVGVEGDELVLCNSGMAAVVGAIETCITNDTVLVCAEQMYSQTACYVGQILAQRGIKVVRFDSSDLESIDRVVRNRSPDILVTETVGNGPDVPVLDLEGLLGLDSVQETDPYIILDNTLPLSTGVPLSEALAGNPKVLGVESGTKSYTFNNELSGIVYGKNPELLQAVRQQRRTRGFVPNVTGVSRIGELLPSSPDIFHDRNRSIFRNTAQLALRCYQASEQTGDFIVSHPRVSGHSESVSPVFFLQCTGQDDQFALTERLWQNLDVKQQADLGQSFGFDRTRILPDTICPVVRVAGGAHTDIDALGDALEKALIA